MSHYSTFLVALTLFILGGTVANRVIDNADWWQEHHVVRAGECTIELTVDHLGNVENELAIC